MTDSFACPECGATVALQGRSPGRHVRCRACRTLVEVPYLTRSLPPRRRWIRWTPRRAVLVASLALAALAGLLLGGLLLVQTAQRLAHNRDRGLLQQRLASTRRQAQAGDPDSLAQALRSFDRLIPRASSLGVDPTPIARQRDATARRLAQARYDSLASLDPAPQLAAIAELQAWIDREPALGPDRDDLRIRLADSAQRLGENALDLAQSALARRSPAAALDHAALAFNAADRLNPAQAPDFRRRATAQATAVARRCGVILEPAAGQFLYGTPDSFEPLFRLLLQALATHGYVARPPHAPWNSLWDEAAVYRLAIRVEEVPAPYLGSALSATRIDAHLTLLRTTPGAAPATVWTTHVSGQTRTPPPGMSAFAAGRLAAASRRDPDAEKLLYHDAFQGLLDRLGGRLSSLPNPA